MLGALSLMMQGYGTLSSTIGAYYDAQARKGSLETRASLGDMNADLMRFSAEQTLDAGQRQASNAMLKAGQVGASQKAAMAANGVDISQYAGNVSDVLNTTHHTGQTEAIAITANAVRAAAAQRMQAVGYQNQALMDRVQAGAINPKLVALGSFLSGASQVAGSWYHMDQAGVFSGQKAGGSYYGNPSASYLRLNPSAYNS